LYSAIKSEDTEARNSRIFTSGLKSDVTIVFRDHDFLYDVEMSQIRVHLGQYGITYYIEWILGPLAILNRGCKGKKGKEWCDGDTNELVLANVNVTLYRYALSLKQTYISSSVCLSSVCRLFVCNVRVPYLGD